MTEKDFEDMLRPDNLIAIATWMTLGDGNITLPSNGVNAFFQCSHTDDHEDYVAMKTSLLSKITGARYKKYWHSRSKSYNFQIWTECHPIFTHLRKAIYLDRRKVITEHAIKLLTPLCLAILFQDDGRYNSSKSNISINKPLFSKIELKALTKGIVDRYGIIFRVRRSCTLKDGTVGHEMGLRYKDRNNFFDIIMPYIVPSMFYKVGRGGSYAT